MQIKAVDQTTVAILAAKQSPATTPRENAARAKAENLQQAQPIIETTVETETPVANPMEDQEGVPGVLRLLREGHFKGVADVRLRINFAEEIAAMEREQTKPLVADGVTGLVDTVTAGLEPFTAENGLGEQAVTGIGEASSALTASLEQIVGDYQSGGITTIADVIARIQTGFDGFVSSVQSILDAVTAPEPETPAETITIQAGEASFSMAMAAVEAVDAAPVDDAPVEVAPANETPAEVAPAEESPSFDFQAALIDLVTTFTAKLQELETALGSIQVLPPLSEPTGNGKAYDKFLAIYNNMQVTPEPPQESNLPSVDAMV